MSAVTVFPLQFYSVSYSLKCVMYIHFYSSSKFMDFVKARKDFGCFVISSCLLIGQFPDCWTFTLSSSLLVWSSAPINEVINCLVFFVARTRGRYVCMHACMYFLLLLF